MDENVKAFVVLISFLSTIHSPKEAKIALLLTKKLKILTKYLDYADIFLKEKAALLLEIIIWTNMLLSCRKFINRSMLQYIALD